MLPTNLRFRQISRSAATAHRRVLTTFATDYLNVGGEPVAKVVNGSAITYLHADHLGSPVATSNTGGTLLSTDVYSPFGTRTSGTGEKAPGFTGHVEDDTGLTYMQARFYDPMIGRFLSNDPVAFAPDRPDMFNRYAYVRNDPANLTDPFGLCADDRKSGLCSDNPDIQAEIDAKLDDPDSLASQVEAEIVASGDNPGKRIDVLKIDGASDYVSVEGGKSYIAFGRKRAEVTDLNGNTYEREISASETFEHELSHALDDVTGTRPSGVAEVDSSGNIIDAGEARAINRTNQFRSRKGIGYQRTGREYADQ